METEKSFEKLKREHAIMLAMLAARLNENEELPSMNSKAFIRDLAHFANEPEFKHLMMRLSEMKEVIRQALEVALETRILTGRIGSK
jgi:hypothetical protein